MAHLFVLKQVAKWCFLKRTNLYCKLFKMKKISLILLLLLCVYPAQSQLTDGKYQIKLVFSQRVVEYNLDYLVLNPSCQNPLESSCKKQIWTIKRVPNLAHVYTLTNEGSNLMLTYLTANEGRQILSYMRMFPPRPQDQREEQYFTIRENRANPGYTIQPYSSTNSNSRKYYLAVSQLTMQSDNASLDIENKIDQDIFKMNYDNLIFSIQKITGGVNVAPSRVMSNAVNSSSVVVLPKSDNKLDLDFKTGGDNLDPKDFMEGLKITIKIRNKPDIVKENANESKEWPNNSIRRVTINIPADVACADINEVILSRDTKSRSANNMTAVVGDNWNLDKVTITSRFKINGAIKSNSMNYLSPSGSSFPLYRFTYEDRDGDSNTGKILSLKVNGICSTENTTTTSTPTNSNAKLTCIFGTGGDNLEGGNGNNVNIRIRFKSSTKVLLLNNVNDTAKWNNFTENTVTKEILNSNDIDINDIKEVEVRHTGGGGMFADNWHVDKIKITINKGNQNKVLVDKVGAPIHMFTGDTRSKKFNVE